MFLIKLFKSIARYMYKYIYMYVCVEHLKRCKVFAFVFVCYFIAKLTCYLGISVLFFHMSHFQAGGCRECHSPAANEDGYDIL